MDTRIVKSINADENGEKIRTAKSGNLYVSGTASSAMTKKIVNGKEELVIDGTRAFTLFEMDDDDGRATLQAYIDAVEAGQTVRVPQDCLFYGENSASKE